MASTGTGVGGTSRRAGGRGRRMVTRMLPGGVIVAAALVTPEFSVCAGDLGGGEGLSDPPEPVSKLTIA